MDNQSSPSTGWKSTPDQNQGAVVSYNTTPVGKTIISTESLKDISDKHLHRIPYEKFIVIAGLLK